MTTTTSTLTSIATTCQPCQVNQMQDTLSETTSELLQANQIRNTQNVSLANRKQVNMHSCHITTSQSCSALIELVFLMTVIGVYAQLNHEGREIYHAFLWAISMFIIQIFSGILYRYAILDQNHP